MLSPGCVKTQAQRYRPVVVEALKGLYVCPESYHGAIAAIQAAEAAIAQDGYRPWHFHGMVEAQP